MNDPASVPKRRGRPKGPRPALTSAQKMRRARERVQAALNAPEGEVAQLPDSLLLEALCAAYRAQRAEATWLVARELLDRLNADPPPLNIGTVTKNPGNPEHRRLFAIPQAVPSDSTALVAPQLPEARVITGDAEIDAMLWLRDLCKHAREVSVLDRALEAASRIKTPHKELEDRYTAWLSRQPGAHPLAVALSRIGEIEGHVAKARQRILLHAEGLAIFGSYETAMSDTAPERMLAETAALPEDFDGWSRLGMEALAEVFARSVNPARLSECAAELHYWDWLYRIRARMVETEHPEAYVGDEEPVVTARREYIEGLLTVLAPVDRREAIDLADALKAGLIDIGSTDDGGRRADVLDHLLRSAP